MSMKRTVYTYLGKQYEEQERVSLIFKVDDDVASGFTKKADNRWLTWHNDVTATLNSSDYNMFILHGTAANIYGFLQDLDIHHVNCGDDLVISARSYPTLKNQLT